MTVEDWSPEWEAIAQPRNEAVRCRWAEAERTGVRGLHGPMTAQELEPVFAEVLAAWPAVVERARGHGISLDDLYGHEEGRPRMGRFDQMIHVGFASRTDDTAEAVHEGLNRVLSVWWSQESRYYVHVWRNCIRLDEDGVYRPYVSRRFPGHQPCPPSPA